MGVGRGTGDDVFNMFTGIKGARTADSRPHSKANLSRCEPQWRTTSNPSATAVIPTDIGSFHETASNPSGAAVHDTH